MSSRRIKRRLLSGLGLFALSLVLFGRRAEPATASSGQQKAALGVDVDFYTGPISRDVWRQMKQAGIRFVVAQAWGGRSRNEFAVSQLRAARSIGEMKEAAYVLLNYDDKVCPSFSQPVREPSGKCSGDPVTQTEPGGRWQVREMPANIPAQRFWRRVVADYTGGAFTEAREIFAAYDMREFIVQRFCCRGDRGWRPPA